MRTHLFAVLLATLFGSVACQPSHHALSSPASVTPTPLAPETKLSPEVGFIETAFSNGVLRVMKGRDKQLVLKAEEVNDYQTSKEFIKVIYKSSRSELLTINGQVLASSDRIADIQVTNTFASFTSGGKGQLFHYSKGAILEVPQADGRFRITQAFAVYQNTQGASVFGLDGQELGRFTAKVEIQVGDAFLSTKTDIGGVLYHIAKGNLLQTEPNATFQITHGFASVKDSKGAQQVFAADGELVLSFTKDGQVSQSDSFFGHVVEGNAILFHASGKKLMAVEKADRVLVSNKVAAVLEQSGKAFLFRQDGTLAFELTDVSRVVLEDIRFTYVTNSGERKFKVIQ